MREYIIRDWKSLGGEQPEPEPAQEANPDDDTDEVEVPASVTGVTSTRGAVLPPRQRPAEPAAPRPPPVQAAPAPPIQAAPAPPIQAAPAPPVQAAPAPRPVEAAPPPRPAEAAPAPRIQRFQTTLQPAKAARRREPAAGAAPGAPPKRRGERSFIIRYNGVFVGFFEAKEDVTPREAYIRVAQELAEDDAFDPERLELWKPVLLKSARPAKLSVVRGKLARFSWQSKKPVVVQEAQEAPDAAEGENAETEA